MQIPHDQPNEVTGLETVSLHLDAAELNAFFPLLQKGVTVPATTGCTFKSLLVDQFSIPAEYVTDRITTVFLDNCPVDDLDHTVIREGARVTLSAAMPGLVGATMRRGGFYAALRQGISHARESGATAHQYGTVRLKLFNLLMAELGPLVLARGLILERDELDELLTNLLPRPDPVQKDATPVLLSVTFREELPCVLP
jgi:hypothetical protein